MKTKFGLKRKTDLVVTLDENKVRYIHAENDVLNHIMVEITYKDFMKFFRKVQKRHKYFSKKKKYSAHFTHLSPDLSIFFVKK